MASKDLRRERLGEAQGVHLVVLELRVANDADLEWMGHDDLLDAGNGTQDVMEDAPVHGRLKEGAAGSSEFGDEPREGGGVIVVDAVLPGRLAVAVEDVDLTETLVRVDADAVRWVRIYGFPCRWFGSHATLSRSATDAELFHAYCPL